MRERTHEVKIRLNDEEFAHLNEMVSRSIYNRETFLRLLLDGCTMQECPKEYNEFRVTLIRLASDLKLFRFSSALTPEEERRLMEIGDEVWALVKKLNVIYAPYYKEKRRNMIMNKTLAEKNWEIAMQVLKPASELKTLPITVLHPFKDHPYKVQDNEEMDALVESIRENGILSPLIVRPLENSENEYEVVSGHRRLHAAQKAGITEVPALIYALDHDAAAIAVVDSNLHREHILPSEKAFAYKMKLEALKHQGKRNDLTSGQVGTKSRSDEQMAESADESARQIQRYIRLTHLIPELLAYMDEGRMALSVGVELSYLYEEHQRAVVEAIDYYDCTPSYAQAVRLRKESDEKYCILTPDCIFKILGEEKANQREKVSFQVGDLRKYFPDNYTAREMQNTILRLLEQEHQRQHRNHDYER